MHDIESHHVTHKLEIPTDRYNFRTFLVMSNPSNRLANMTSLLQDGSITLDYCCFLVVVVVVVGGIERQLAPHKSEVVKT